MMDQARDPDRTNLLNLGKVQGLGAPIVSIGGAFDGVFPTGIIAVLLAARRVAGRRPLVPVLRHDRDQTRLARLETSSIR